MVYQKEISAIKVKSSIILLGAGGHAKACIDVIEQTNLYNIVGLIGIADEVGKLVLEYSVIGDDKDIDSILNANMFGLVCLGQIKTAKERIRLFQRIKNLGKLPSVIVSPHAYVSSSATIRNGTIIMNGVVVNSSAVIGENCIINSMSLIEHDVEIGDHCHISTGVRINGNTKIGNGTFVGSGSVIREGVVIGENCLIGMGQSVLSDCDDGTILANQKSKAL